MQIRKVLKFFITGIFACIATRSFCQETAPVNIGATASTTTLKIGDPAPEVHYGTWLKGTPVENFSGEKIYVIEFWATWCGPCNAEMPHISEMAKKYEKKVTFASFDVWEAHGRKIEYNDMQASVKKFVDAKGDKMDYNVATDDKEEYMANKWVTASGQAGIPVAYIVKNKTIIWIGHPANLDRSLEEIINEKYNMQEYSDTFYRQAEASNKMRTITYDIQDRAQIAVKAKNWPVLLQIADSALNRTDLIPTYKYFWIAYKIGSLYYVDQHRFVTYTNEMWPQLDNLLKAGAVAYPTTDSLHTASKEIYQFALSHSDEALGKIYPPCFVDIYKAFFNAGLGNYTEAVRLAEKSIAFAKSKSNDPTMAKELPLWEQQLAKYKKKEY